MKKLSAIFLLFTGLILGTGFAQQLQAQSSSEDTAAITITEYSDYECPACGYFYPIVKKLKDKYGDQIKMNYKFFPLNSHQFSALAARAAQAAKNQGKFLEMHNKLFENQKRWSQSGDPTPMFVNFARDLGLDIEQFKNDLNAAETQRTVMEQKKEGQMQGVRSTPTFFIGDEMLSSLPRNFAEFDQVVQEHLNQKNSQ